MFGLTFWLRRYHYYKNRFYSEASPQVSESACYEISVELDATPIRKAQYRQKKQSEVDDEGQ
jgi:hypothetical protein